MVLRLATLLAVSVAMAELVDGGPLMPRGPLTTGSLGTLIGDVTTTALVLLVAWVAVAACLDRLRRRTDHLGQLAGAAWPIVVPATMRLAATATLGVGAVTGVGGVAPVLALDTPPPDSSLPQLDRPRTSVPATVPSRSAAPTVRVPVTVAPGDSLWRIAARDLGPAATTPEIAAHWPRWYEANRARIGPDPDLIMVGTRLRAPSAAQVSR